MYEVLTGAPPFHGESALSLMMKHQSEQPQTLKEASMGREFPESLEAIVAKTMEKNPDMRYQSLLDLAQDLAVLQQGQSNLTENVTLAKTLPHLVKPQTIKAKPIPRALIAAVGIGCLAIGILVGYLLSPKPEEVVKVVDRPVESLSPREEAEKLGYVPYVKMEGRGLDAVREFRFPEAFSIGKFQTISPMAKQTTLQEAQGNHRVSVADRFFLEMSNMDLVRHPLSLRGFGETDVNSLHLLNDTKDYAGAVIYNPEITFDSALVYCSNWKAMYRFYAWGTTVSNVGMRCLQDLPNLFEVDVTDTRVTADGIRCLNAYPEKITVLGIGAMPDGRSLIPDLKSTKILTTCNFSKIDLDDDDLKVISKVKTIALLGVHENSRITDTGIVYLKELPNLVSLTTGGTSVTSASTSVLAKFSKLKYLQIDGDHWTAKEVQKLQSLMPKTMIAGAKMDARKKGVQNWDWKKEL